MIDLLSVGILLQAIAIVHFARRRPARWLWIIIIGGGLGALAYILLEVVPDAGLLRSLSRSSSLPAHQAAAGRSSTTLRSANMRSSATVFEDGKAAGPRCYDRVNAPRLTDRRPARAG
jgi:hypothetical protein